MTFLTLLYLVPLLWMSLCYASEINGKEEPVVKAGKYNSLSRAPDIDFIMMAPSLQGRESTDGLKIKDNSTKTHEVSLKHAKNNTKPGIFLRFMQIKSFWNTKDRNNNRRRLLEMTLKPMFFVCCLCVLVLIYLLYRAVRIKWNLKNDKHVIQPADTSKIYQNEA